jgi:hypothetical protein
MTTHVEHAAEALGREIARDERQVVEPPPDEPVAPTLFLGPDDTGVPIRAPRSSRGRNGVTKTHAVKLCTAWSEGHATQRVCGLGRACRAPRMQRASPQAGTGACRDSDAGTTGRSR